MKGVHLLGYIESKDEKILKYVDVIKKAVWKVCKVIGIKVVDEKYHIFESPNGITYCFILAQSHFVIHTWPEESKVFFDIFTCEKELNKKECVNILSKEFKGKVKEIKEIRYR